jgi:Holliday junction DNA helicase RuvA
MYGFAMKSEREMFDLIVEKVSGIGPKIALNLLSQLSVRSLQSAIINADVKMLSKCPGIGKKTAERMVVELKDKLGGLPRSSNLVSDTAHLSKPSSDSKLDICFTDAVAAMVALGYNPSDADKSIRKAQLSLGEDAATEDLIRTAFAQKK